MTPKVSRNRVGRASAGVARPGRLGPLVLVVMLTAQWASAQSLPLPQIVTAPLTSLSDEIVVTVDLDTLPARPRMLSTVVPDASHPDLTIETEWVCNLGCFAGSGQTSFCATPGSCVSDATATRDIYRCSPFGPWTGETCDVIVRPVDFGAAGAPADVTIEIRGETEPLTNTQSFEFDTTPQPATLFFGRDRDTTIYQESVDGSNGQGQFLWAGTDVQFVLPIFFRNERRSLLTFDVGGLGGPIPPGSTIDDAELILQSTGTLGVPVTVSVTPVGDEGGFIFSSWASGDADAPFNEFLPAASLVQSATWTSRSYPFNPWSVPGGNPEEPAVATALVSGSGEISFQSPALTAVIEDMWLTGNDRNGLLLRDFNASSAIATQGAQFGSGENPNPTLRPELAVTYTPPEADPIGGDITTNALTFIGEGEDFRWIYDTSVNDALLDGRQTTAIGGECVVTDTSNPQILPYEYDFSGDPSYTGLDCCTWQIRSVGNFGDPDDDILGTGQALFFINLDPSEPSNQPGDFDGDGIVDVCDNCIYNANGPALGTCLGGTTPGATCNAQIDCGGSGICHLSQEDEDGDFLGDVCEVPEPRAGLMLGIGFLALVRSARTRARITA